MEEDLTPTNETLIAGTYRPLSARGIYLETLQKWRYQVGEFNGQPVHIANYVDTTTHKTVSQKIRFSNKDFRFLGDARNAPLYGQWLWRDGGRRLVITEGEIDALSVSQLQENKWPVVSIPNGAAGAAKSIRKAITWVEQFDEVVFCFDADEPGRKAAIECAQILSPGKARIATLPLKDANEMLINSRGEELIQCLWGAKIYRPDGIVGGHELWDMIIAPDTAVAIPYPYEGVTSKTRGLRRGELVTVTAGSGIGKSQLCREIAHWLLRHDQSVGYIALEESVKRTALGIMGISMNKPLHLLDMKTISETELKQAYDDTVGGGRFYTYDHFGSLDSENLLKRIRFMAVGCHCGWIVLDHISIVISGMEGGDERRQLDKVMTDLRSLVEELKIGLILVSHLKRPDGKGHEEGAATSLSQLRGSAGIAQLSDMVIGMERNQQDTANANISYIRVLKNRYSGETGICSRLEYDKETGRLREVDAPAPEELQDDGLPKDF